MTNPEQLTFGEEYYVPPPSCYQTLTENIFDIWESEISDHECEPIDIATDMNEFLGAFDRWPREDIERSIRIYRERREKGLA